MPPECSHLPYLHHDAGSHQQRWRRPPLGLRHARHSVLFTAALYLLPNRPLYVEQFAQGRVPRTREATHGIKQFWVYPAVLPNRCIDMRVHDTSKGDVCIPVTDNLHQLAFEMCLRLSDARGPHFSCRNRRYLSPSEFVLAAWKVTGREAHFLQKVH